ncbi:MAG: DUF2079 domain-containing protein [Caldilineaceae bacterium]|nr:DUF2079 domain-containing protein [Caldilineaceae bacterium]
MGGTALKIDPYRLILFTLILVYTWLFTGLAFAQHAGMRTHKADLGQIAQAVWNSSRGRFVEMTDNGFVATRMTDHVEPILALISPILWVWDDTRALLLLQVVAVAIGAWPLYELARLLFVRTLTPAARRHIWEVEPLRQLTDPLALAVAIAYLLAPQLQSALLTEFHAVPLAVPLILWALWAVEAQRWRQFAIAVVLVAAVKEETALLAALLGLWAIWRVLVSRRGDADSPQGVLRITLLGAGLTLAAVAWFYVATFVIVPAHAVEVYGVSESTYFRRYGALGDSPVDILRSFFTQPGLVWQLATEPARLAYLRDLLTPFGWLALLAPEVILLGAPVLLANQLSAYPAQYYGEFHYSAPVLVYFAAAAALGLARLWRWAASRLNQGSASFQHLPAASASTMAAMALVQNSRTALRPLLALVLGVWLLGWAGGSYIAAGRGPGGARYNPTPITAHHRLLSRFTAQIPPDAAVTATAAVHPHVSHRRSVYQFPIGLEPPGEADWALLDVTTATDMAPGDVRTAVESMLAGKWGVVDGADGFLLLRKGAVEKQIPPAFYDFARTRANGGAAPLTLMEAAAADWPRWRATQIVTVWQVGAGYDAATMSPSIEIRTPGGDTLYRFDDAMPPALVWYPPEAWQAGDQVRVTTLPLYLPRSFGVVAEWTPGLAVLPVGVGNEQAQLVAAFQRGTQQQLVRLDTMPIDSAQELGAWLTGVQASSAAPFSARFRLESGESLILTAKLGSDAIWPGGTVDARLAWQGGDNSIWPPGVIAFVHLRQAAVNQSQQDGLPRYFVIDPLPTVGKWADWRQLDVPLASEPDVWQVVVGLYDPVQGTRLPVVDVAGNVIGEEAVVGTLVWREAPVPDQSCALIPATCASQAVE